MISKKIEEFNDSILKEAAERFDTAPEKLNLLSTVMSYIYEYNCKGSGYMLRITHSSHFSSNMVQGEIEWLNYLADNGVNVCRAIPSVNGKLVEIIEAGDTSFTAVAFVKATGKSVQDSELNLDIARSWGKIAGKMHHLTKSYKPSSIYIKRQEWHEFEYLKADRHVPGGEAQVLKRWSDMMLKFHAFPRDTDSYGLIHCDIAPKNFFIKDNDIMLFDFDESQYQWFAYDIAFPMFIGAWNFVKAPDDKTKVKLFMDSFMEDYTGENTISSYWLKKIPDILKLQEFIMYIFFCERFDLDNLKPNEASLLNSFRNKIENDIPYFDFEVF